MPESPRILIVEDEEGIALHLSFLLQRIHYFPLEPVAFGEQVLERVERDHPSLILMDISLAGQMDGIEAANLVRDKYGIPVVYLSAIAEDMTIKAATGSDPFGYLVKPVKEADLRAAIELALYKHRMEMQLRESEERYRLLFEKMTNGSALGEIICDEQGVPVDYRFLAINPAFGRITGVKTDQLIGRKLHETAPNENSHYLLERYGHTALTGETQTFEFHLIAPDRDLRITVYSPKHGQFATIVEDITERRRAEQALQASETLFRQLAEGVREVFWLHQPENGQVLYVSPAYERVFGRPCEELYKNPASFLEAIHPDDRQRIQQAIDTMQEQGVSFDEEYRIVLLNGSVRWIWARTFPVQEEDGKVTRFSGIAEDITERRLAEEQLRESYNRLQQSMRRMTVLRNIDQAITTQIDLSSMASNVLGYVADRIEIDAAVLFVPNVPGPGRVRGTGPLSVLRLAGLAGLPEEVLDGSVLGWQMQTANTVFQTSQPIYINDLHQDNHPGAQMLLRQAGFSACAVLPLAARGQVKGVLQCFRRQSSGRDGDWQNFLQSLALQTAIAMDNVEMFENLKRSNHDLTQAYEDTIKGWAEALEMRHSETRGHAQRVTELAGQLAGLMGISGDALVHFRRGVLLHDIGKMAIPDRLLTKTGSLSEEEWITMRQHPTFGYRMLQGIEYLHPALDVVLYHHEKWDGTGYPKRLKAEDIPLVARIFAVVDVWDALTNERAYRPAWPTEEALNYIVQNSGKHFDPRVVEAFLKVIS